MIVLNFSHPLTPEQREQVEKFTGQTISLFHDIYSQFDNIKPFHQQVVDLIEAVPLSPQEWQAAQILINPPSYNFAALVLLAELHGRMGYMPPIIRIRPVESSVPQVYAVAEIINLQAVRDAARKKRT